MEPFLRPATTLGALSRPSPEGWITHPAGLWRGRRVEVVYDARLHDVALVGCVSAEIEAGLANAGWHRRGQDGAHEWWVRDRIAYAQRRIQSPSNAPNTLVLSR